MKNTNVSKEWSGSPCPIDPDNYWIDDKTGERVSATTGKRTRPSKNKTISLSAKCSDLCSMVLNDDRGQSPYDGSVPGWFPAPNVRHYGDYIQLEINLETGQILNWKRPTAANLKETFGGK